MVDRLNTVLRRMPAWAIYILAPLPVLWIYYLGLTGGLGIDPAKRIEHELGLWSLWLLIAGLAVTPIRRWFGLNLLKFRRAIGVVTFFYLLAHLLTWLVLDVQFQNVWADIVKRWYITVGMLAFVLMLPLALTSNNCSLRRLGPVRWRRLHKMVYPIALLGALHFLLLVKGFQWEPILYALVIAVLLAARLNLQTLRLFRVSTRA
ncbi:protein-methionine-sulfoxide reductase heme-binding subunit MsrQ [Marivita geojedonensis]|uniref:Protein-methionine-sulfoxide reductase heme-binding subunit MsrQ n=1 Tax=Marivita geojedonensis TaxID=1123756 RepID=A0A1X4NL21_9RHOB|nr:protein-methionine-sulfoxide reductase heme-binding subunit MsrQ [Marivita geojedonensis]OSQ50944.1 sulfite oxidase [Marivita geojedonensis]PRY80064.1 sulfoxide reductase heme-binding subunit YedZ [Marivita geojedonensis]